MEIKLYKLLLTFIIFYRAPKVLKHFKWICLCWACTDMIGSPVCFWADSQQSKQCSRWMQSCGKIMMLKIKNAHSESEPFKSWADSGCAIHNWMMLNGCFDERVSSSTQLPCQQWVPCSELDSASCCRLTCCLDDAGVVGHLVDMDGLARGHLCSWMALPNHSDSHCSCWLHSRNPDSVYRWKCIIFVSFH